MTEVYDGAAPAELDALPTEVKVTAAFAQRMPTQRIIDVVERIEHGNFGDLAQHQPFRIIAFRALLRDYPNRDPTTLWLHAYDVEVEMDETPNPTGTGPTTTSPPSAAIGG